MDVEEEIPKKETFEDLLNIAANIVVNTCMEVRRHESVLVIAYPSTSKIGQALYKVCSDISANVLFFLSARPNSQRPRKTTRTPNYKSNSRALKFFLDDFPTMLPPAEGQFPDVKSPSQPSSLDAPF